MRTLWANNHIFLDFHRRSQALMEAGLTDHVWTIEEMCSLLPEAPKAAQRIEKEMTAKALACGN
jgi:hypothetical protein